MAATAAHSSGFADGRAVRKRLQTELMAIMTNTNDLITAFPLGDDLFHWTGTIRGSPGTVYDGLSYKLTLEFKGDYPYAPPTVLFATPCFHPNVDQHGNICLDILKEKWSPTYSVTTLLVSLQSLLADPNNDSPLNSYAASIWGQDEYRTVLRKKYQEATKS